METVTSVALSPAPGFCVKSRSLNEALIDGTIQVEKGLKIFVNVAWDANVPPPPPATDDVIRRAMHGLDSDDSSPEVWFVPIILSGARRDSDKAGRPAIVFDCLLNPSIKSRTLKHADFKNFLIELVFQRIEAQTNLMLSRNVSMPNIAAKGTPQARRALVPRSLYPPGHPNYQPSPAALVQEVPERPINVSNKVPPKGILKASLAPIPVSQIPTWTWSQHDSLLRIVFDVPGVTCTVISESTLDIEPRRIILHVPALFDLDLDLTASDAELTSIFGDNNTANTALGLKRMRDLHVDNAKAEWRAGDKAIILWA